jgi:cytochrome P450
MDSRERLLPIDFADPAVIDNPYPALAGLRRHGQPIWHDELGVWLAARHSDVNDVLRSRDLGRTFQPREPESTWESFNWLHADSLLDNEPPTHTRLKSLITQAFNPKRIQSLQPQILAIVDSLLDQMEEASSTGPLDFISSFAEPLPVKVIASLLGVPEEDEELLRPWSQAIVKMYEVSPSDAHQAQAQQAADQFADYVMGLMRSRVEHPGDDLISELAHVEQAGDTLSARELVATCVLLLNAGHEASVNGLGNGMVALLQRENQASLLRENPSGRAGSAVEEFLRFDAPLHYFERTAKVPTTIGGVTLRKGDKIVALLGSANRDENVFAHPDEMDITRTPNPHLGFGAGIHFCIGAPLARSEMTTALGRLFHRFPKITLAGEPISRGTFVLRGWERIPVSLGSL